MQIYEYLPAFLLGFLGGFHCVGMCGGIVASLSVATGYVWKPGMFVYQLSRISTYIFLGFVTAYLGSVFIELGFLVNGQKILSFLAGVTMLILSIQVGGFGKEWFGFLSLSGGMFSKALKKVLDGDSVIAWVSLGVLNGLLPCGLVYSALAMSLETASPFAGGFMLFAFGVGTLPWLIGVVWLMDKVTPTVRLHFTKIAAVLIAMYGMFLMYKSTPYWNHSMMQM